MTEFRLNTAASRTVWGKLRATAATEPARPLKFWGSGLPFCPRAFWLDSHLGPTGREENAEGQCRMDQGTAIHAVVQRWLAKAGLLYGDYVCPQCPEPDKYKPLWASRDTFSVVDHLGLPKTECPRHPGVELRYRERRMQHKGIVLKPDGILKPKSRYVLLEIKTTNPYSWRAIREPQSKHVDQANAYACVLQERGLDIAGSWIWYLSVDNPLRDCKSFAFSPDHGRWQKVLDSIKLIKSGARGPDPLPMICPKDALDIWCAYHSICGQQKVFMNLLQEREQERQQCSPKRGKQK